MSLLSTYFIFSQLPFKPILIKILKLNEFENYLMNYFKNKKPQDLSCELE